MNLASKMKIIFCLASRRPFFLHLLDKRNNILNKNFKDKMASTSQAEEKEIRIDRNLTLEKYEIGARIGTGGYG